MLFSCQALFDLGESQSFINKGGVRLIVAQLRIERGSKAVPGFTRARFSISVRPLREHFKRTAVPMLKRILLVATIDVNWYVRKGGVSGSPQASLNDLHSS